MRRPPLVVDALPAIREEIPGPRVGRGTTVTEGTRDFRPRVQAISLAGGRDHLPIWKVEGSILRLAVARDEAAAWVQDLVRADDLREVEPERYVAIGGCALFARIEGALDRARARFGHLGSRSRGRVQLPAEET